MIIRVTLGLILLAASQIASASLPDFATIVEETSPAVVKIIAQAKAPSPAPREPRSSCEMRAHGAAPRAARRVAPADDAATSSGGAAVASHQLPEEELGLVLVMEKANGHAQVAGGVLVGACDEEQAAEEDERADRIDEDH